MWQTRVTSLTTSSWISADPSMSRTQTFYHHLQKKYPVHWQYEHTQLEQTF